MIEDTLAKIEAALKDAAAADPKKKTELTALLTQLKRELKSAGKPGDPAESAQALSDTARAFEASHPKLVQIVAEICRELAALGI